MKIFAIYGQLELVDPPAWLADFRARFDKPYPFHLTFKQPCWVPEDEIPALKEVVAETVKKLNLTTDTIHVRFNRLMLNPPESVDDGYIMLRAEDRPELHHLQQTFVAATGQYHNYTKPELAGYEQAYEPHITIGRKLDPSAYQAALADIPEHFELIGIIPAIVLAIVPEDTPEHADEPANRTVFLLTKSNL